VGTGLQKITISCQPHDWICEVPEIITDMKELEKCECRQINLEEIETAGGIISEVYRKDPNVNIRAEIYRKSWKEIKNHPILGIGWGKISNILGTDERGTPLNSSNIFLEAWLGMGIFGLVAFLALLGYILFNAIKNYFHANNEQQKAFQLFTIASWFGLVFFNFFNAGIFLGFFWVWLAISVRKYESNEIRNV
jgi:O-antigen ligase